MLSLFYKGLTDSKKTMTPTTTMQAVQVGDIFEHSGGYNSTHTTFVKVVALTKSGKTATVVTLGQTQVSGDWMNGLITCDPTSFSKSERQDGKPMTLRVNTRDNWTHAPILRGSTHGGGYLQNFYKWDGKPIWNNCD